MFRLFLQITGATFYLLNKVFFSASERVDERYRKKWRITAWIVYLAGIPAWVFIFIMEHNWIAAAVETSGVPAILLGLISGLRGDCRFHLYRWLNYLAKLMIIAGLGLSFHDFGGIESLNQILEIGIAGGFLLGTYFLAKERASGYIWLLAGNINAALLMMMQGYFVLMWQQFVSVIFVADAFIMYKKKLPE